MPEKMSVCFIGQFATKRDVNPLSPTASSNPIRATPYLYPSLAAQVKWRTHVPLGKFVYLRASKYISSRGEEAVAAFGGLK